MDHEYMHPIPLDPGTDVNAKVKLHVLYDQRKPVASTIVDLVVRYKLKGGGGWARYSTVLEHHLDSTGLQVSADSECHLCTLIWRTLSFSSRRPLRTFEIELYGGNRSSPEIQDRSYELEIRAEGLSQGVFLDVRLKSWPKSRKELFQHSIKPASHGSLPPAYLSGKSILSYALDLELDAECKLYQYSLT